MLLPTLQNAPQTGCFSKGSRGRVLPRRGTSRAESTKTSPTARGKGRISGDKQSPFGLWPWCLHEQLAQLCPHSLSLLPPPTLRSGKGTGLGGGAAEGKDTPAPCGKTACTHSHVSSGVTTALSWAVSPTVAGLVAPCHGSGHQGALLGPARLWHHVLVVLVVMVAPEPGSPLDTVSLARQELGPCPWGGGTVVTSYGSAVQCPPFRVALCHAGSEGTV